MSPHNRSQVLEALCRRAASHFEREGMPLVTVTYAQSLDGSVAGVQGEPLAISCDESLVYTHDLRARHDAILVGINTILADDPRLTTRLVDGDHPRPVILDSRLRIPIDARVLKPGREVHPIVFTTVQADAGKQKALEAKGVNVVVLPADENGWICLRRVLSHLGELGLHSVMVEGGGTVIKSFIQSQCVHHFIVTLSLTMVAGTPLFQNGSATTTAVPGFPMKLNLSSVHWEGADMILHGDPVW